MPGGTRPVPGTACSDRRPSRVPHLPLVPAHQRRQPRRVVGGGHGTPATASGRDRPPTVASSEPDRPGRRGPGVCRCAHPDRARGARDAWLTTAMVSQNSERLKFLVAFRPGFLSPTLAAQMASTFQRHTGGRLLLNVVTGGESHEQQPTATSSTRTPATVVPANSCPSSGSWGRQERRPARGASAGSRRRGSAVRPSRFLEVYFGGSSPAAGEVAARHADVHSPWGEPPAQVAVEDRLDPEASPRGTGRTPRFGIRLHVITRDTAAQAWAEADRMLAGFDAETVRAVQQGLARSESEGQRRMLALHGGSRESLEIHSTCGPASGWCAAARARPWSAATTRSSSASRSTTPSASTSSSSPAIRTRRRRTGSARASRPGSPRKACGLHPDGRRTAAPAPVPFAG
ncbi:LLM class flavin-dependent oxidoreductase [Streptomyces tricolor]|nr:LLM class flavin-dependent oxidoreductase [Streptomyces tricolor]